MEKCLEYSNGWLSLRRSDFLEACFQNNSISHIYVYAPERQPNLETNYCYLSHCPINLRPPTTMICVSLTYSILFLIIFHHFNYIFPQTCSQLLNSFPAHSVYGNFKLHTYQRMRIKQPICIVK
jgi:hypothetical protein